MWSKLSAKTKSLALGIIAIFAVIVMVQVGELMWYGGHYLKQKKTAEAFSGGTGELGSVLIVGDSTGVGVGADNPNDSVAGLLARDGFKVKNLSVEGRYTSEIFEEIEKEDGKYDLVLIFSGGIDIMWFADLKESILFLEKTLEKANEIGDKVVLMPPGNVGLAPLFREPVGIIFTNRTAFVRKFFMEVAEEEGVIYVDLFTSSLRELFIENPLEYFSADLVHPSSKGYEAWYLKMRDKLSTEGVWW